MRVGFGVVCAVVYGVLFLWSTANAGQAYVETLPPGATIFNPAVANENGIAITYNVSTTGTLGALTGLPSSGGTSFYAEIIGPKTVTGGGLLYITLSHYAVTHPGNDFISQANCGGLPQSFCTVNKDYAYAETVANGEYACSNFVTSIGYNSCTHPTLLSDSFFPLIVTTNTPMAISLSTSVVASGAASETVSAEFDIYGGAETPYSGITDPADYQLVFGPTIASLPSYGNLPPVGVPEPASFVVLATGVAGIWWRCRAKPSIDQRQA